MNFLNTFRGRLLLILTLMLVASIGVQYYLNLLTQRENIELRDEQNRSLVSAFAVAFYSLTGTDRLSDLIEQPGQTFLDDAAKQRVLDIIIIDNEWQISDSLNPDYLPSAGPDDEIIYKSLSDLTDLPPLMENSRLGDELNKFPNQRTAENQDADNEAHVVPIETSKGRWYAMVLMRNDRNEATARAAQPLVVTLLVLSITALVTFILVWRFTTPIANLSDAARRVADGDLAVRVPDEGRRDEMGRLAERFNEMTAELEKSKQLEEQLQQAEKSAVVGRLGSAIAHEIRNPLNYINLTLDHLRSKFAPEDTEKQAVFKKLITQVKAEVGRIDQQISDFLNYSRPASVSLRPVDARQVVEDSLRIVQGLADENDIKIAIVERGDVSQVMGDPELLRSVFNNLFINAVQAMGAGGGNLTVKIDSAKDLVCFEIADTGNGIPEENLQKIFEPYFSTKETGTGLGLAIVQKVIESHEGMIEVSSKEEKGTTFTVWLPKAKQT